MTKQWEKDAEKFARELPARFLSATCIIIAVVHFGTSGWKADWVLLAFVVLCYAPWLGYVFESIGKDGVKFRNAEQGESAVPAGPQVPVAFAPVIAAPPQPAQVVAPVPAQPDPDLNTFLYQEMKVLATLWKYQKINCPRPSPSRWTFIVGQGSPEYMVFAVGFASLVKRGFADTAPNNGQAMLTNLGFDFCQRHDPQISNWRDTFDKFAN